MTAFVSRPVTTTIVYAALSLFMTVLTITTFQSLKLRWDGSFCTLSGCAVTAVAAAKARSASGLASRTL